MLTLFDRRIGHVHWTVVASERADGDVHPRRVPPDVLAERQLDLTGRRWAMSDQVHGTDVVELGGSSPWPLVGVADVLVADRPGVDVAIWTADCAPVFLLDGDGGVVAFHAGWRGVAAGIVDRAVERLGTPARAAGVVAVVGPTIGPCCYEFGRTDAERVAHGAAVPVDHVVRPASSRCAGRVALDVPEVLRLALARHGIAWSGPPACTACSGDWFSHRVRADAGRHATVARSRPVVAGDA